MINRGGVRVDITKGEKNKKKTVIIERETIKVFRKPAMIHALQIKSNKLCVYVCVCLRVSVSV